MSSFTNSLKNFLSHGAKFIRRTASKVVSATKYKSHEIRDINQRRELISELGAKMFEHSQNGFALPADAAELVQQIIALDCDLTTLRADHAAEKAAAAQERAAEKAARAAEKAAAQAAAAISQSTAPVNVNLPEVTAPTPDEFSVEEDTQPVAAVPTLDVRCATSEPDAAESADIPTLNL